MSMVTPSRQWIWLFPLVLITVSQLLGYADSSEAGSPHSKILFKNVNVVPMDRETVLYHRDVEVYDDKIAAIYPTKSGNTPVTTEIIDGSGKWLIPGLADMHMHISPQWMSADWPVNPLKLYLASGVTTVRCFGPKRDQNKTTEYIFDWRKKISEGKLHGPAIYSSGPILYGPVKNPTAEINRQVLKGYHFIKLYSYLTPEEFNEAIKTVKNRGIYVAGHIPMMVGLDSVLEAGINEIAHVEELAWEYAPLDRSRRDLKGSEWIMYAGEMLYTFFKNDLDLSAEEIAAKYRDSLLQIADKVKRAGATVSTTLYLDEVIVDKLLNLNEFQEREEVQLLPRSYLKALSQGKEKHQVMLQDVPEFAPFKRNLDLALLWALKEKNTSLVIGSDSGTGGMGLAPGVSLHEELKILVKAGYTPYEALSMGTVIASQIIALMTEQDDFGTIAPGKRADLILLGSNPLENIENARDLRGVMAAGRWYDERTISNWIRP